MGETQTTLFGGVAGRVLWGTLSVRNLIAGIALGGAMFVTNAMLIFAGAAPMTLLVNHALLALLVSRFVLNGQYGEWQGSFLSNVGGSWVDVAQVAGRFLAMNALWLLPLMLSGLGPTSLESGMARGTIVIVGFYALASMVTPPLMLIAAVSAESFADLVNVEFWRSLFANRQRELLSVYATYCGGTLTAALIAMPVVLLAFVAGVELGIFAAAVAICFVMGVSIDLLGRLCGFFSLGDIDDLEAAEIETRSTPAAVASGMPLPSAHAVLVDAPIRALPPLATPSGPLPPLLDAKQRTDAIMSRFDEDPAGVVHELEGLCVTHAVSAQVLGALCIARYRLGEHESALLLAGDALVLAFERGHLHLAAEIFRELRGKVGELGLNREQILAVAGAAAAKGDLSTAGEAFSMVLNKHPTESRAARGLLDVAERILREKQNPQVAIKVYRFLEERCAGGPLADAIIRGLTIAERRAATVQEPA